MIKRTFAGVTTNYSYDQAGRLKDVKVGSVPIAEYQYDAYGRLIKTTEGTQVTIRLPMGNETAYEKVITPGMPIVERRYIIALGKYIARDEISAGLTSRVYYHGDHLGSTRALSGDDAGSFTYDPFGNIVYGTGDAADHSHQFTGKPIHSTGLYYYGARFYDPTLGRFINMDPAKDGTNWWVYCANNPLRYVDPTGMFVEELINYIKHGQWLTDSDYLIWSDDPVRYSAAKNAGTINGISELNLLRIEYGAKWSPLEIDKSGSSFTLDLIDTAASEISKTYSVFSDSVSYANFIDQVYGVTKKNELRWVAACVGNQDMVELTALSGFSKSFDNMGLRDMAEWGKTFGSTSIGRFDSLKMIIIDLKPLLDSAIDICY